MESDGYDYEFTSDTTASRDRASLIKTALGTLVLIRWPVAVHRSLYSMDIGR